MASPAVGVSSLLEDEPELAEAVSVVLERTADGDPVTWADVNDELSSGEWGRLIEQGVLVDAENGFELGDRDAVREALQQNGNVTAPTPATSDSSSTTSSDGSTDDDDASWTTWDKMAAGGSVLLFIGYSQRDVRNLVGSAVDLLLGPLDAALPFYLVILTLAVVTGLYSTILQSNLMDMEKMGQYQEQMQEIQERREAAKERGDDEALEEIQQEQMEAMGDQLGMFKLQFRPMVWIMLLTVPAFLWMYWKILQGGGTVNDPADLTVVMPLIGGLDDGWRTGVVGPMQAWIVWYFLCSMAFTQVIRKALNIQTTPT